jgi:Family of unknown function (DUF5681)
MKVESQPFARSAVPRSSTSFKPGQSGNPRGRPKKGLAFAEVLRERLMQAASDDPQDRRTKLEMVVDALIDQACSRDVQAIREIAARLDGRVPEATPFELPFDPAEFYRREADAMRLFEPGAVNGHEAKNGGGHC